MVGTLKNGKIVYENPYSKYNYELYGVFNVDTRQIANTLEYEIYNPRKLALAEGKKYEFEVIYFEDGQVAELYVETETE